MTARVRLTILGSVLIGVLVALLALAILSSEATPQHGSPYDTGSGTSYLMDNDHHLRACDQRPDGMAYTAWSKDSQSGNFAFTTDGSGSNDGNCANKWLDRNHDKHGHGSTKADAQYDIDTGFYSRH